MVSGNVDIETGNIVFSGDVIVYGDVMEHMLIESLGNVYVYGSVYNATITATGSIHIRGNIIGAKLYSGYYGVMFNRLYHTSKVLCEKVTTLHTAAKLLIQALEAKRQRYRYGQIVSLLMENKFPEIRSLVKDLLTVIVSIQHLKGDDYHKLKASSELFLQPAMLLETATSNLLQSFMALLQETQTEVASMQEDGVTIRIKQCQNSELKSNGDIVIVRDGVLLSSLYSSGNISFLHESGVCRGSMLDAGGHISAQIVGGQTGVLTVLKAKQQVAVRTMYAGRICVGKYMGDIMDMVEDFIFDSHTLKNHIALTKTG